MSRLKNIALFTALAFGVGLDMTCQAGVDCLQYPIYYDDAGNYLFVIDEYLDQSDCNDSFDGEYYMWVTTQPPYACPAFPETCPACSIQFTNNSVSIVEVKKQKSAVQTVGAFVMKGTTDRPFPSLLNQDYVFGKDKAKADLPKATSDDGKVLNPSAGITLISSSWVKVQPKTPGAKPIDVKLFTALVDYERAGITFPEDSRKPKTRIIRVGFEMTGGDTASAKSYTPYVQSPKRPTNFSGDIDVVVDGDKFTYHVVSKTPLFR